MTWHRESRRHSLAARGIPTSKKESIKTPVVGDIYTDRFTKLNDLKVKNNEEYQNGTVDYNKWDERNEIINRAYQNVSEQQTTHGKLNLINSAIDAYNGINKLDYYYKVGAYNRIRGYGRY